MSTLPIGIGGPEGTPVPGLGITLAMLARGSSTMIILPDIMFAMFE
jgi:hypothetical protein